jgi:predicted enzyme related to lactoylglutathione lyase
MATLVHFDIPAENPDRAKKFYHDLFGWKIETLPGPMNYSLIETTDAKGTKGIGGGMAKREPGDPTGIVNFIGVESIDKSLLAVEKLGGKILQPKQAVPGWGHLAVCLDTENNRIGLFQEEKK